MWPTKRGAYAMPTAREHGHLLHEHLHAAGEVVVRQQVDHSNRPSLGSPRFHLTECLRPDVKLLPRARVHERGQRERMLPRAAASSVVKRTAGGTPRWSEPEHSRTEERLVLQLDPRSRNCGIGLRIEFRENSLQRRTRARRGAHTLEHRAIVAESRAHEPARTEVDRQHALVPCELPLELLE